MTGQPPLNVPPLRNKGFITAKFKGNPWGRLTCQAETPTPRLSKFLRLGSLERNGAGGGRSRWFPCHFLCWFFDGIILVRIGFFFGGEMMPVEELKFKTL